MMMNKTKDIDTFFLIEFSILSRINSVTKNFPLHKHTHTHIRPCLPSLHSSPPLRVLLSNEISTRCSSIIRSDHIRQHPPFEINSCIKPIMLAFLAGHMDKGPVSSNSVHPHTAFYIHSAAASNALRIAGAPWSIGTRRC
jgi:hypothetical protein